MTNAILFPAFLKEVFKLSRPALSDYAPLIDKLLHMAIKFTTNSLKIICTAILVAFLIAYMPFPTYSEESSMAEKWFSLGNELIVGENGKPKDYEKAFDYYEKAAKMNHAFAQYNLGIMYLNGFGCTVNKEKAISWLTKAAEQNDADAQYLLGVIYRDGVDGEKHPKIAVEWFRKAANNGCIDAQYNLGVMYRDGFDDTINYHEAIKWFQKAADQGDAEAQINLGRMLLEFFPISRFDEAFRYFTMAAEQGNIDAQQYLGYLYTLEKKYEDALKWSLAAAKMGNARAQENIGRMYLFGQGVEQNYLQAYMWFMIASDSNPYRLRLLEEQLSVEEIEQAKRMAKNWERENLEPINTSQ